MHPTEQAISQALASNRSRINLPIKIDEFDVDWMQRALSVKHPGVSLAAISTEQIIWGTGTKVFVKLDYRETDSAHTLPTRVCIKGPFDERMRKYYDLGIMFVTEAAFYRDVAPLLNIPLPQCLFAEEDGNEGIVILENLSARSATFGDPTKPWTPETCARILDVLARMHAVTWGWKAGHPFRWLTLGSGAQRGGITAMMSGDRFRDLTGRAEIRPHLPRGYDDRDRVLNALQRLWELDDLSHELTLAHGDAHMGQTYSDAAGTPGLLDWQSAAIMPWSKDVAYFLGSALSISDRRTHERDLLEHYLQTLQNDGGPRIDRASAWNSYRQQMLFGMVWPVVTEQMQSIDVIAAMSERFLTAIGDHEPMAALGC